MFDDKPVQDMFDGVEKAPDPKPQTPVPTPAAQPPMPPPSAIPQSQAAMAAVATPPNIEERHARFGAVKIALIVIIVLALIGVSLYAAYRLMWQTPVDDGVVQSISDDGVTGEEADDTEEDGDDKVIEEPKENKTSFLDSDGDGLSNAEELEAGTLANKADTDDDGLGDREEVEVYGTDADEEDTDGDGYLDGQEVAGGFNPNGEGKLFVVPGSE